MQLQQSHKGELVQDISEYHGGGHLRPLIHEYQDGGTSQMLVPEPPTSASPQQHFQGPH